jgi:hypothetical protein
MCDLILIRDEDPQTAESAVDDLGTTENGALVQPGKPTPRLVLRSAIGDTAPAELGKRPGTLPPTPARR